MHKYKQHCILQWLVQSRIGLLMTSLVRAASTAGCLAQSDVMGSFTSLRSDPVWSARAGLNMVAPGYNGATSLTQHLNFPQQPSLLPQPWAAAGLAATAAGAQPGVSSGACTEQLFRMDGAGSLYRQMPPGLEASLATAAEWSSANAWDASSAPSWLILSACSRSSREVRCFAPAAFTQEASHSCQGHQRNLLMSGDSACRTLSHCIGLSRLSYSTRLQKSIPGTHAGSRDTCAVQQQRALAPGAAGSRRCGARGSGAAVAGALEGAAGRRRELHGRPAQQRLAAQELCALQVHL